MMFICHPVLSGSHLEGAVQSLGFQVPDVNTVVQTSTDQKLRRGTQTYTGLSFLSRQESSVRALVHNSSLLHTVPEHNARDSES